MERYFTFWRRFAAGIFDSFIILAFFSAPLSLIEIDDKGSLFWLTLGLTTVVILYNVLLTGLFGNTVGKLVMGNKVLDLDEQNVIGVKRAFIRDLLPIIIQLLSIVIMGLKLFTNISMSEEFSITLDYVVSRVTFFWFIAELITMFLNSKRRAVHDLLAASVVISLKGLVIDKLDEELAAKKSLAKN